MKILNNINLKKYALPAIYTLTLCASNPILAKTTKNEDTFEHSITPSGTTDQNKLKYAPDPSVTIEGVVRNAKFVVDISTNVLYKYDNLGNVLSAYRIASGKKSTPTHKGVRIVSHTETYPYKTAPASSKRRRSPKDYGPKIIILNKLNTETGEQAPTGEFIHGNRNASTLGQYVSQGCMRMDNEVIKTLSEEVVRGDIVVIK